MLKRKVGWVLAGLLFLLLVTNRALINFYVNFIWFKTLNYLPVFTKIFFTRIEIALLFSLLFFFPLYLNLLLAARLSPSSDQDFLERFQIPPELYQLRNLLKILTEPRFLLFFSLFIGFLVGISQMNRWGTVLSYFNRVNVGIADPIFQKDIGFYLFSLPFFSFIQNWLSGSIFFIILLTLAFYGFKGAIKMEFSRLRVEQYVKNHILILIAVFILLKAWQYRLNIYGLLFSSQGVVFGAGYADIHARLIALKVLSVLSILCAVSIFTFLRQRTIKPALYGIGALIGVSLIMQAIYPAILQKTVVEPNEVLKESPYIEHNIKYTTLAYGLTKIKERKFPLKETLTIKEVERNKAIIKNIRLWDPRPLKATYRQLQGLRLYYDFPNVDIDRYEINGEYRQVFLSARELNQSKIPQKARTWINERMKYTHGYGVVLSPVGEVTREGFPSLLIKDIPPVSESDLKLKQPEIYYGELTDNYCIVKTKTKEFDYPKGDKNIYTFYEGAGGTPISSTLRRLLLSLKYLDFKMLLTRNITSESRIMLYRNIRERCQKIAPFLHYDQDPYIVISSEGKLFWILDAYTVTNMYPYATPYQKSFNYIRNSVKIIIDTYHGDVSFYVLDNEDPLIKVYQKIFPTLFKPFAQMPLDLKKHIRYPETLFKIQAEIYRTYHMRNPEVFYNKEDYWDIPREIYSRSEQPMEPYYMILKIEEKEEFFLLLPFTPTGKNNMIAWLAAACDGENYGNLLLYKFPKDKLVYGPMQIEARIDQNPTISEQLTLWGQRGSSVIRGNLLVIPIEQSILYVEPLYLKAEQGELPEFKRIILGQGNRVVMGERLDDTLSNLLAGTFRIAETPRKEEPTLPTGRQVSALVRQALHYYQSGVESLKKGDWAKYGETQKLLQQTLQEIEKRTY
ncbi:MAG: UPF0182 family protein [Candidatus Omnitrophica bacterium]|nr:UPF0182 family protein [Candidatus Omnitrophota bacterium]